MWWTWTFHSGQPTASTALETLTSSSVQSVQLHNLFLQNPFNIIFPYMTRCPVCTFGAKAVPDNVNGQLPTLPPY